MTEKEMLINKIITYPNTYAMLFGVYKDESWEKQKLEFMEISRLIDMERDIFTMERNKQKLIDGIN